MKTKRDDPGDMYGRLYNLFDTITPVRADCGVLCERACCGGDDETGMLLFPFEKTDLDVGRLAMWRLQNYEIFGGTWLSDYVPNKLGGFVEESSEMMKNKPKCALIGEDGNIFNLMGIASRTLKDNGMKAEAKEMCDRITSSGSYDEALCIIGEYVDICSKEDLDEEYDEEFDMTLEGGMC